MPLLKCRNRLRKTRPVEHALLSQLEVTHIFIVKFMKEDKTIDNALRLDRKERFLLRCFGPISLPSVSYKSELGKYTARVG